MFILYKWERWLNKQDKNIMPGLWLPNDYDSSKHKIATSFPNIQAVNYHSLGYKNIRVDQYKLSPDILQENIQMQNLL